MRAIPDDEKGRHRRQTNGRAAGDLLDNTCHDGHSQARGAVASHASRALISRQRLHARGLKRAPWPHIPVGIRRMVMPGNSR